MPAELVYTKKYPNRCYTVCWNSLGNLVAGGETLSLYYITQKKSDIVPAAPTNHVSVSSTEHFSSVAELPINSWISGDQMGYVSCFQAGTQTGYRLCFYSPDLESGPVVEINPQRAYYCHDIPTIGHRAPAFGQKLAILPSSQLIIVSNHLKKRLDIFSDKGQIMFFVEAKPGSCATGLHCLPDGSIIASFEANNEVVSYNLDIPGQKLNANWTCGDLREPTGVSSDSAGYIYVSSRSAECIYIISSKGGCLINNLT